MQFFCETSENSLHSPFVSLCIKWSEVMEMLFGNQNNCCGTGENSNSWWIIVIAIIVLYFLCFDRSDNSCCDPCDRNRCC